MNIITRCNFLAQIFSAPLSIVNKLGINVADVISPAAADVIGSLRIFKVYFRVYR